MLDGMPDDNDNDDWVEGGTMEAQAYDLTFFSGVCLPVDRSRLPDPPDAPDLV